jgi:hypothetical protein
VGTCGATKRPKWLQGWNGYDAKLSSAPGRRRFASILVMIAAATGSSGRARSVRQRRCCRGEVGVQLVEALALSSGGLVARCCRGVAALAGACMTSFVTRTCVDWRGPSALERASAQVMPSRDGQCCREDRSLIRGLWVRVPRGPQNSPSQAIFRTTLPQRRTGRSPASQTTDPPKCT